MERPSGRSWQTFVAALATVDAIAVILAILLAFAVRYKLGWLMLHEVNANRQGYMAVAAVSVPAWLAIFAAGGLYDRELSLGGSQEYTRLVTACTFGFATVAVLSFLSAGEPPVSRGWLVALWPLAIGTTSAGRFTMRRVASALRRRGRLTTRTVIVGTNAQAVAIAEQIHDPTGTGLVVSGFLDDRSPVGTEIGGRWRVVGAPDNLASIPVDEAIVVQHALTWESLHELMQNLANHQGGPRIRIAPTFVDIITVGMRVGHRAHVPVITLNRSRIAGLDRLLKVTFEVVLTLTLLAALAPFMLLATWQRRRRHLPIIVRRPYHLPRGRTVLLPSFSRLESTPVSFSRVVERSPALFTVLRGTIALIGPRPTPVDADASQNHPVLRSLKPGLIGPVSLCTQPIPAEAAIALELGYIRNYSIWRDVQIACRRMLLLPRSQPAPGANEQSDGPVTASVDRRQPAEARATTEASQ